MPPSVRRFTAVVGSGLLLSVLVAGTGTGVRAQDPDECSSDQKVEKVCVTATVRSRALPITNAPLGDDEWFTIIDPPGDVRTNAGDVVVNPDVDIVQAWWRVDRLDQPMIRFLQKNDGIEANDFRLNGRTRFLQVVVQVDGDTIARKPEKRTLLVGIATDVDGLPGDDVAASVDEPFDFWSGTDTIHQAGQFSTGDLGAGSTSRDKKGDFTSFYNIASGIRLDAFPEANAYHLLAPVEGTGNPFRIFTQAAHDGVAHQDLLGDPEHANGLLLIDGVRSAGSTCVELYGSTVRGQPGEPAMVQVRVGGVPPGAPFTLEGDLIAEPDRTPLSIDAESNDDGIVFDVPLTATGKHRIRDLRIFTQADAADPELNRILIAPLQKPFMVADNTGSGHLLGGMNCARDRSWLLTTDACEPLAPRSFDSWDSDQRFRLDEDVAATLGTDEATLVSSGDDAFSTCSVFGDDRQPIGAFTMARRPVTIEEARDLLLPGLQREGCTIEEVSDDRFDLVATRECAGDPATFGVFTLLDDHSVFAQVPLEGSPTFRSFGDTIHRFFSIDSDSDGIPDAEDDDIDGDGILDVDEVDWDNDGIPNAEDRFPYHSHKA